MIGDGRAGEDAPSCERQGLRHADENGGTGTRRQRIRDFRQRKPIPKTENSADLAHYFPENGGGLSPALSKMGGGHVPPRPPPVAEPLAKGYMYIVQMHPTSDLCKPLI